ncbi:hypothetical protein BH11PLA2_BH11PLA2_05900 [soil metagenome]
MLQVAVLLTMLSPAQPTAWPLEEIQLANGAKLRGIILEESATGIRFRVIRRPPGRPTVTLTSFFPPGEVTGLTRLNDKDKATLKGKLAELDAVTQGERKRADELNLKPVEWLGKPNAAKQYDSEQFVLISSADDEVTRRAALRLEQIFTAYSRYLPPRVTTATPVTILLAPNREEYQGLLGGRTIVNPAVYDPAANRIVIGSELRTLSADVAAARLHHVQQLAVVDEYDKRIHELYKNAPKPERDRHIKTAADERAKVLAADRANDGKFDQATAKLFALLYHESFHAYVINHVYPPRTADEIKSGNGNGGLPRWLNEGLAQLFETAVLDGGELRVGHADTARLDRVQTAIKSDKANSVLAPIAEVLIARSDSYIAAHASQKEATDAVYLTGWAVTFHLAFERRLLGTKAFDEYLTHLNTGTDPRTAFEKLVGTDLDKYSQEVNSYMLKLRPDGSLRK